MSSPKPFCVNPGEIKAFVLGCDPTAFDKNQDRLEFEYVFDLGKDQRYFAGVLNNLELIGLSINDIYVQNLITDYQEKETGKNKEWNKIAKQSIPARKMEFDSIDKSGSIPVFLTSEILYNVLLVQGVQKYKAQEFYVMEASLPILASYNLLNRPLFPLYRHFRYKLNEHKSYLIYLQSFFR